jgi:hypothetical protein
MSSQSPTKVVFVKQPEPERRVMPTSAWLALVVISWLPVVCWTKWMGWW